MLMFIKKLYLFLNEKLEETEIKISSKKNNVKILDEAILMVAPVYPKSSLIFNGLHSRFFCFLALV